MSCRSGGLLLYPVRMPLLNIPWVSHRCSTIGAISTNQDTHHLHAMCTETPQGFNCHRWKFKDTPLFLTLPVGKLKGVCSIFQWNWIPHEHILLCFPFLFHLAVFVPVLSGIILQANYFHSSYYNKLGWA